MPAAFRGKGCSEKNIGGSRGVHGLRATKVPLLAVYDPVGRDRRPGGKALSFDSLSRLIIKCRGVRRCLSLFQDCYMGVGAAARQEGSVRAATALGIHFSYDTTTCCIHQYIGWLREVCSIN
jgi:hypothetical protein